MRSKGAPVYFIPGNHDWDKGGKNGLAKIKQEWYYLEELIRFAVKTAAAGWMSRPNRNKYF